MGKKASDDKVKNDFGIEIKTKFPDFGAPHRISTLAQTMRYNPKAYEQMLQLIRQGVYPWVASESLGVIAQTFYDWMRRGKGEVDEILKQLDEDSEQTTTAEVSPYGKFFLDVRRCSAQARSFKEVAVGIDKPEMWLRSGPGRSEPDLPGWSEDTQRIIHEGQIDHEIEDYTRAPTDAETLQKALVHLEDALPGGLAGLKKYIEQNKMKTIEGKVEGKEESNGKDS